MKNFGGERKRKKLLKKTLSQDDWRDRFREIIDKDDPGIYAGLMSLLCDSDALVKRRAAVAFGDLSEKYNRKEPEKTRNLLRRFVWQLTEESGGIAWGVPEAMCEVLSRDEKLAESYVDIVFSYAVEDDAGLDNYLEFDEFRSGVFWGLTRLAENFPKLITERADIVGKAVRSETDPEILAYLCIICERAGIKLETFLRETCLHIDEEVDLYLEDKIVNLSVSDLARKASSE